MDNSQPGILICEGNDADRTRIFELLKSEYKVTATSKISEALTLIQRGVFLAILISLAEETSSQDLNVINAITIVKKIDPDLIIIVMAAEKTFEEDNTMELEREIRTKGIFYYILKPIEEDELKKVLREAFSSLKKTN